MFQRLTASTALLLTVPPLFWAGNAVAGRLADGLVPPMTLNFLRWALAFALLLPFAGSVLRRNGPVWPHWRALALLGLLGVGCYNALLYLALKTSSPLNVTLVASSTPVVMLAMGRLFFGQSLRGIQLAGAALSSLGVLVVLSRGDASALAGVRLVAGDMYVLLATLIWAWYSWLLTRTAPMAELKARWAGFILAQAAFGLGWSGLFMAGEWALTSSTIEWGWPLALILLYVALGPAILAYRCWGLGVARVGPNVAGFFANLTPLFAAMLSAAVLGEAPHAYHLAAFALIVGGIVVANR
jgi:drug/metabolite transporter (DMT)-like permease